MTTQPIPTFPAWIDRRTSRGVWIIAVRCGYCDNVHTHGGGSEDTPHLEGHRIAHCVLPFPANLPGYILAPEDANEDWATHNAIAKRLIRSAQEALKAAQDDEHRRTLDRIAEVNSAFERSAQSLTARGTRRVKTVTDADRNRAHNILEKL